MSTEVSQWRPWAPWVALLLWIATVILGMQALYDSLELFLFLFAAFGSLQFAQQFALAVPCLLAIVLIAVVMGSGEYHRTRLDQPQSWRLFAWVLGVELAIVFLHAFLL